MKKNTTKRALLLSVISIVVCLTMLVGSTFAWFTDNASTSVNKIQAGTLKIALEYEKEPGVWDDAEGKTLDFIKAEAGSGEEVLWEPGCTYNLPKIRIRNDGNLALKYKILIKGIIGDAKLNEVIDWTFNNIDADPEHEYELMPEETSDEITISGHMQETAGNEYKGLSIEGAFLTVIATQDTVEYDSHDNQYDKDAPFVITNQEDFLAALETVQPGDTIYLGDGEFTMPKAEETVVETPYSRTTPYDDVTIQGTGSTELYLEEEGLPNTEKWKMCSKTTFRDVTFKTCVHTIGNGAEAVFENCKFNGPNGLAFPYSAYEETYVKNMYVRNCEFNNAGAAAVYITRVWTLTNGEGNGITFENCKFNAGQIKFGAQGQIPPAYPYPDLIFKGCTFNNIPEEESNEWNFHMTFLLPADFEECEFNKRIIWSQVENLEYNITNCTMNGGVPVTEENVLDVTGHWNCGTVDEYWRETHPEYYNQPQKSFNPNLHVVYDK